MHDSELELLDIEISFIYADFRMMSYYARPDNQLEDSLWTYKYKPKKAMEVRYVESVSFCIEVVCFNYLFT
jgi:hypothetical protein